MPTDQLVQSRDVLDAVMQIRRQGRAQVLRQLEQLEPDLAEYVMEESSRIYQAVLATGVAHRHVQRLHRRCEGLVLVTLLALRHATLRLWRQDAADTRLARIDPTLRSAEADDADASDEGRETTDEDGPPDDEETSS